MFMHSLPIIDLIASRSSAPTSSLVSRVKYKQRRTRIKWQKITYRLVVELTLVLLRDRLDIIESPQLTTVPLLIEKVRNRYKSSLWRGLYGRSGNEHTRGRTWSGTATTRMKKKVTFSSVCDGLCVSLYYMDDEKKNITRVKWQICNRQ